MTPAYKPGDFLTEGMTAADVEAEYGPECPDIDMECVCCQAWMEFHLRETQKTTDPQTLYGFPVKITKGQV